MQVGTCLSSNQKYITNLHPCVNMSPSWYSHNAARGVVLCALTSHIWVPNIMYGICTYVPLRIHWTLSQQYGTLYIKHHFKFKYNSDLRDGNSSTCISWGCSCAAKASSSKLMDQARNGYYFIFSLNSENDTTFTRRGIFANILKALQSLRNKSIQINMNVQENMSCFIISIFDHKYRK